MTSCCSTTNHLDPETVAAVVATLAGDDGTMLVASPDEAVFAGLGVKRRVELG